MIILLLLLKSVMKQGVHISCLPTVSEYDTQMLLHGVTHVAEMTLMTLVCSLQA